ncbi:MAG TPA: (2Fe-2S)-binding protein [Cyanobacteria bacterium UBA8530]|nr:(2Fe-2S)-binding protein [Cyanobacteria bacterium UBA8530]
MILNFTVNGKKVAIEAEEDTNLLEVLRDKLSLTGTKCGCSVGKCGVCMVLFNGASVQACLIKGKKMEGAEVLTIEGLGTEKEPHPLQVAFLEYGAVQCGFCTPAMLLTAKALLDRNPHPTEEEIRQALKRVLCRCTGYVPIIKAIQAVAEG